MTDASVARKARKATIKDVAALAGVSPSAVTIALHDRPGVSKATREKILDAVRELGWRPNLAAATLSGHAVHTVGLVIARPARLLGLEPFYMEFISGLESVLSSRNCSLLLRVTETSDEIDVHREWWQGGRINGSILVDLKIDDPRIGALTEIGLPAVVVGHPSLAGPFTSLWTDDAAAIEEAVRYLAALGHRHIGRVTGPPDFGHSVIRQQAFETIAAELDVETSTATADFSADQGSRAFRSLLLQKNRATAVIFDNDLMAVAALGVADEFGLSVPNDLSLLAWDDSQLCQLTRPALSAMSHDIHAFGVEVATALFAVVNGAEQTSHAVEPPRLIPRGSTAPPRP
ncbi:LacI family DNA-binding transcriptional regulator [Actinophytocola oryzae]|uniref:LacI family DNA-binding transcriptional regulator n=1 Tax=Actinophytocola oryzae TaxID=502181 RepID=UPI001AAEEDD7|nr:LacI family DNA-binding transcriptional regulator [Actinophytocola oryzae]